MALKTLAILPTSLAGAVTLWVGTRCALAVGIVAIVHSWELRDAPYKKFGIGVPTEKFGTGVLVSLLPQDKGQGSGSQDLLQGLAQDKVQAAMLK